MKRTATLLLACTAFGVTAQASAQSLSRGWDSYRQQQKQQAGTQGAAAPAAQSARPAQAGTGGAPAAVGGSGTAGFSTVTEQTPAVAAPSVPAYAAAPAPALGPAQAEQSRIDSGAFISVQRGRGEVFSGYKQDMLGLSAGYRWRAGSVTLIGLEGSVGRLDRGDTTDDVFIPAVKFGGIGGTARFNFGDTPLFAVVRVGSWYAEVAEMSDEIYGGYASLGLGVDIGKHASASVMYTNYVYANDYYDYAEDTTINRADVLNAALEVRF
ncbi:MULTISPECIES: hypothetical protein [Xanthomonas]|nr:MULTISPECIES: hypothetical protein [Xanthomonas]ATS40586.1 hypothetical protein XcfCFBP6988P_22660 [Xanthomonas citri pv. phaseoli var. fuscans]ATS44497.1 hypothetical protein XcfCFBP6989P_20610 [Xanthomonas citri pv. phaseoli var. fuscans]ATS48590.1 hypothetical protein XcfCFBP6990P_19525 [Xanthomonas citri pv. phaseoli var. fuscans]ATS85031.1 hypothetical protein XcfCFBP6991P_14710 [Xanthomonas citri pv. phaseoli var. fuscans]QWN22202.1 hypothetical protein DGM98_20610 [Xanthomonas citri]